MILPLSFIGALSIPELQKETKSSGERKEALTQVGYYLKAGACYQLEAKHLLKVGEILPNEVVVETACYRVTTGSSAQFIYVEKNGRNIVIAATFTSVEVNKSIGKGR